MPRLICDADNTLIHVGGDPDGKPREHVIGAVKLFIKAGWDVYVWSHGGADRAFECVRKAGLGGAISASRCYEKPLHPYTLACVRGQLGFLPDLQFDDLETEAIPGVLFVHTPRTGDSGAEAEAAALAHEALVATGSKAAKLQWIANMKSTLHRYEGEEA